MNDFIDVDCLSAGQGSPVVLVHCSVSGARQWKKLIERLAPGFSVLAPNLYGYGATPAWQSDKKQTLSDQAGIILQLVARITEQVSLVGHSFGASVAMKAAALLGDRVEKLILIEPNPFFLLRDSGRMQSMEKLLPLRDAIKSARSEADWQNVAEHFADYWGGPGTWAASPEKRRKAFVESLRPNAFEWDAIMGESTPVSDLVSSLPENTVVIWDPATVRPIREIVELLRKSSPWWFVELLDGGHMAPLTHPQLVNPVIEKLLKA